MDTKTLQDILIQILRFELNQTEPDASVKEQLTPEVLHSLYSLSKQHDSAHIVADFLYRQGLLTNDEISEKYNKQAMISVYRYERMKYAYEQICNTFDEASIPYIPLKGSVIRPYYPKESMRTSCDIDILVKEKDLESAIEALTRKDFRCGEINYHDVSLWTPNNVHLELHFSIQENIDTLDAVLKDAWLYAILAKGGCYAFTEEFFVFHMFAHMSYHFLSGGCGMKALADVWVMEHKMGIQYECARQLLEKAGIYRFAMEISRLVDVCFSGKEKDDFSEILLSYIIGGGVYGTVQNKIAVEKSETKNTFLYALQRLFLPYKSMITLYPMLKRLPFLLPICWIARFCKMLFGGRAARTVAELKTANNVSDKTMNSIEQMRERLGL